MSERQGAGHALTAIEKSYFDTIRQKAPVNGGLHLMRMDLDGKDVAVILTEVFNRFTSKAEGMMPLAMILDADTISMLREMDGASPTVLSPFDLDPGK